MVKVFGSWSFLLQFVMIMSEVLTNFNPCVLEIVNEWDIRFYNVEGVMMPCHLPLWCSFDKGQFRAELSLRISCLGGVVTLSTLALVG